MHALVVHPPPLAAQQLVEATVPEPSPLAGEGPKPLAQSLRRVECSSRLALDGSVAKTG
jgi:hypothetical protein